MISVLQYYVDSRPIPYYCFNRIDAGLFEAAVSIPKNSSVADAGAAAATTAELDASSDCQSRMFLLSNRLL